MLRSGRTGFIPVETIKCALDFELQEERKKREGGREEEEEEEEERAELPAQFKWESGPRGTCTCMHVRDR